MKRVLTGFTVFCVASFASLWVTSIALQPEAIGAARVPDPALHPEAVIRIYGADVWGVRGNFAMHTWIAIKAKNAPDYDIFQVIGWRLRRGQPALSVSEGNPARPWFGSPAILLHERRGSEAESIIARVREAVASYPFAAEYKMWPGPNSNSFTAWIGLEVPELGLDLPAKAIGQSWMKNRYPEIRPARH